MLIPASSVEVVAAGAVLQLGDGRVKPHRRRLVHPACVPRQRAVERRERWVDRAAPIKSEVVRHEGASPLVEAVVHEDLGRSSGGRPFSNGRGHVQAILVRTVDIRINRSTYVAR